MPRSVRPQANQDSVVYSSVYFRRLQSVTPPPIGERGVLWWACLSVCLSVCVCVCPRWYPELHVWSSPSFMHVAYSRGSVLLWRCSDMLHISGFVDDVIFAHKLVGCSTSRQAETARLTRTQPWAWHIGIPVAASGRSGLFLHQGLLGHSGRVEYLWHHACT